MHASPLAEQRRIVAKVEQLMALVDKLQMQFVTPRANIANILSTQGAKPTPELQRKKSAR